MADTQKVVPGAVAPELTQKEREIEVPSFVSNNRAKQHDVKLAINRHIKSTVYGCTDAMELEQKITEFSKDASTREREIVSDLELVLSTIMKYGVPDKIKFACRMEYDSDNTKKNKVFNIKR